LTNQELLALHALLLDNLYLDNLQATNHKEDLQFYVKPIDRYEALHKNFLKYGTKVATNFLIIDVDHVKTPIEQYKNEVYDKLGIAPNWILKTSKGYHVGFILKDTIFLNNTVETEKLQQTKQTMTYLLNADIAGSHRLIGYWRNPLMHKSIFNDEIYDLETIYKLTTNRFIHDVNLFNATEKTTKKIIDGKLSTKDIIKINLDKIDKIGFIDGNRNNYLYTKIISFLYNGKIKNQNILDTLIKLNNNQLQLSELKRIEKSIKKYNIKPNDNQQKEYTSKGIYNDALWKEKIHNYKDKTTNNINFERQKIGQKITVAKIIKSTIEKLIHGYTITYKNKEIFTNKNLIKNSKVSKSTIKRYRNNRKIEDAVKAIAFKQYIKAILNNKKSVKADEPPIKEVLNKVLEDITFYYKPTNKTYKFKYNEDDELIFYEHKALSTLLVA